MADRVRQMMKRSTSKLSTTSKGSVNHIGTAPYRFKIVIFISYAENIKSISEACISWERRGKIQATHTVKVKDGKAVFRQALSMECTLFRKTPSTKSKKDKSLPEELKFDEKKAKMYLRKSGPQGKAVAKLALNVSDYIKGASSTVFADMKLSDGTLVVTKIEATMIAMEKKKKGGSRTGSEVPSEYSDGNSVDDSLFGDEEDLENAQRMSDIPALSLPSPSASTPVSPMVSSPVTISSTGSQREEFDAMNQKVYTGEMTKRMPSTPVKHDPHSEDTEKKGMFKTSKQKMMEADDVKKSPSMTDKLRSKLKVSTKKEKAEKSDKAVERSERETKKSGEEHVGKERRASSLRPSSSLKRSPSTDVIFEVKELKKMVEYLKKENSKLKKAKNAAMEEIEALRADLKTCEDTLEALEDNDRKTAPKADSRVADLHARIKRKETKITSLEAHNTNLLEEMEEQHEEMRTLSTRLASHSKPKKSEAVHAIENNNEEVKTLQKQIADLRVALQREPEFLDVVDELKVAKVNLALANMEKEQALFELQNCRQYSHGESSEE